MFANTISWCDRYRVWLYRKNDCFAGYQADGTRGALMIAGASSVKNHGQQVPVRAHGTQIHDLSAHADYREILRWMGGFKEAPRKTFVMHGEPDADDAIRKHIAQELIWSCEVPDYLQKVEL